MRRVKLVLISVFAPARAVIAAGRNVKHAFAIAMVLALTAMPVSEALAYYIATSTGTGSLAGVTGAPAPAAGTVSISGFDNPTWFQVNGGTATQTPIIMPGDVLAFNVKATCLTGCPVHVATISLSGWSSDKAGCDPADLPGSFTMPVINVNLDVTTVSTFLPTLLTYVNLGINQNACQGAAFTFNFTSN